MMQYERIDVLEGIDINKNKCIKKMCALTLLVY